MARQVKRCVVALIGLAAGCAVHWDVQTYESPGANVAGRQTFFWKGGDFATAPVVSESFAASTESQIRDAVVTELQRKGYAAAPAAAGADLVVTYQVTGIRRFVEADAPRVGAPSPNTVLSPSAVQPPPLSSVPREVPVRDGSVTVFIDDSASGRLLWRGEVATQLRAGSAEEAARDVVQMAREIAKEVPAHTGH